VEAQLGVHYVGDSAAVDDIIREKTRTGQWRPNPDCPSSVAQVQYWVRKATSMIEENTFDQEIIIEGMNDIEVLMP
jgi:hypothetical protein